MEILVRKYYGIPINSLLKNYDQDELILFLPFIFPSNDSKSYTASFCYGNANITSLNENELDLGVEELEIESNNKKNIQF